MAVKVLLSLPEEFLAQIDDLAREEQRSRSELLREALRQYIQARRGERPRDRPAVRGAVAAQDALSQVDSGQGSDSAVDIRRWREAR